MVENQDYKELLQLLNAAGVEYLVVGGHAVMEYSEPAYTKDLDLWIHNTPENAARIFRALAEFGAPLESDGITTGTFADDDITYQIGIAPNRIDILTTISGVEFTDAWSNRKQSRMFSIDANIISLEDLIKNKTATGRDADARQLKQLQRQLTGNN